MMQFQDLAEKLVAVLLLATFISGLAAIVLRRVAAWGLVGQIVALKSVVAGAFLFSFYLRPVNADLLVLSLVALGLVPVISLVGILVLHRCSRFGGTLDMDEEDRLRH
jgi:hypothetical protein